MKKLVASLIAASMLVSAPAYADHPRDEWRGRDYNQRDNRRGNGCGWLCGAIIGGVIVGALSSDRDRRDRDGDNRYYDNRYYPPDYRVDRRYCVREQITEWRYGERYVYWQTTCN